MEARSILFLIAVTLQCAGVYTCDEDSLRNLPDVDQRRPEIVWDVDGISVNDAELDSGWYRPVHNGWQYLMVDETEKPAYARCSTYWPIYVKGNHTAVDQLDEQPIDTTACIRDDLNPCSTAYSIQMRKCNEEIHYYLQPTKWFSAYCFRKSFQLADTSAPAPENVNFGNVIVSPELGFNKDEINNNIWYIPYIKFRCVFDSETDLFYSVSWYIDQTRFTKTMGPSKNLEDLTLHENELMSNNINLGVWIQCGVTASAAVDGLQTEKTFSPQFYAGIKVLNTTVFIDKQRSAKVQMVPTVPIGCKYFKLNGHIPKAICQTEVKMFVDDNNPLECQRKKGSIMNKVPKLDNQLCSKYITTMAEGDDFKEDNVFDFEIVTTDHTYDDDSKFILKLQFGANMGHEIWGDYFFPDIKVFVQNTELYKSKICKSRNDPHMTTFDGYLYEQQATGTYILYINFGYKIEVQHTVHQCNSRATCTCGVAVSAGQDIFMINRCSNVWFLGFTQCGDGGILQVVRIHDHVYMVFTPIGTRVKISLTGSKWMNVDIYMAPKDMGNVEGLCGKADGNRNNDLKHRNSDKVSTLGTFRVWESIHVDFSASWRVPEDSDENLFNPTFKKRQKWSQQNGLYCVCSKKNSDTALCSSTQYLNCIKKGSITKTKCHVEGRRKRNTGNHSHMEIRRLLSLMAKGVGRRKRQDETKVNITSEAMRFCTEKINGTLALTDFKDISANDDQDTVISWCAFDISIDNDTNWADIHVEAINEGVKNMMELQPTYVANHTEEVNVFLKNTCPMNCSNRGICSDEGVCSCFTYFQGPDCSIDERDGLTIRDIQGGGECDLADGDDCECFYVRSDSIQENFTCEVKTSKILINENEKFLSSNMLKGGFEDIFTGVCCVPENIIGVEDVFVAIYSVAISNNGFNFGNAESVYVFDSKCQAIENRPDSSKRFTMKEKHCFIDGYCVADEEMKLVGCLACSSSISMYNWTEYNPCKNGGTCNDETDGYSCSCVEGYGGMNCEYEVNECESIPCQNDGTCMDEFNGYTCMCETGFTGTYCEINIDECEPQPCKNGGICSDQINQYSCNCTDGYEGTNCETDFDECSSDPCQNHGTCNDYVNGYTCSCTEGYFGVYCQTSVNTCESNPCQNGGSCVDSNSGRSCTCQDGFEGVNCEININDCPLNTCQNGGSCVDLIDGFTCTCVQGFNGSNCATNIDDCSTSPCENGGSCEDGINQYTCSCAAGYEGGNCGNDINECLPIPCKNGGNCSDGVNQYTCTCASGYEGLNCEKDIDECEINPCQNGGSCSDGENQYTCVCSSGYDGVNCENDINECLTNPCKNGGNCSDGINQYTCTCASGYDGLNCENDNAGPKSTEKPRSALVTIRMEIVFPITVNDTIDLTNQRVQQDINKGLINFFQEILEDKLGDLTILAIRSGSLIVNFEIKYYNEENAAVDLTKGMTELVSGEAAIEVMNETFSASSVTIDDLSVNNDTLSDKGVFCEVFVAINGPCANSSECTVVDGSPSCITTRSESAPILVIVVVSCTIVVLVLTMTVVAVSIRAYRIRRKRFFSP